MIGLEECGPMPSRGQLTSSRERAAQAIDYYNTNVHKAWENIQQKNRASFNDKYHNNNLANNPRRPLHNSHTLASEHLCRSNSSLELLEYTDRHERAFKNVHSPICLRRNYGSHGSIDVIENSGGKGGHPVSTGATSKNEFFEMLQNYRPAVLGAIGTDQRSPGPQEYLKGKVDETAADDSTAQQSPKLRTKLKFWNSVASSNSSVTNTTNTSLRSAHTARSMDDSASSSLSSSMIFSSQEAEEISRRRAFTHYDCQSMTTNINFVVQMRRNLLAKRRNTTTGASAASTFHRSNTPDGENLDDDYGDGFSNDLVENCPFFRNEIGGEEERVVSLTRVQNFQTLRQNFENLSHNYQSTARKPALHRPPLAYGVAILEYGPGDTFWRNSTCPYQKLARPIEFVDQGALYYRKYFSEHEHQNWFGIDDQLGPIAISIRREKIIHPENQLSTSINQFQYRLIIRTSELNTLRGSILEDSVPNINIKHSSSNNNTKLLHTKEILDYICPEIQQNTLRLAISSKNTVDQLLKLDEQGLTNNYKVGVLYCKKGQNSEEDMYNNETAGPAFTEFLETIGKKVRLNGFEGYKAGLDNKTDSTGLCSMYAQYQDCEVMFHVSTMLPFTPNNRQQLLRKRHIGNDIVTIVFQEPGSLPFTPKGIRSQFQHIFIIVHAINPCTENTHYKVAVSRSKDVQVFGPPIKEGAIFPKGKAFADFLLAKIVNAENAAHRSEKFVTMATRTRQEYLKDLVVNHATTTALDTGQKFSIFSSSSKKKEKIRLRFIPDVCQRGAILWQVLLDDNSRSEKIECYLGISADTFVLIEENGKQIIFVTPCKGILGWSSHQNSLRIYHHQGECVTIHIRDVSATSERDELIEIMDRLKAVTNGVNALEYSISRNIMGQLGFHVQPDGLVTRVENSGHAYQSGLRQNSRLVEICKVAVSTLTYDQMVDLLKTSLTVILTVIPPLVDGTPRKGCMLQNCKYTESNFDGDYENLTFDGPESSNKNNPNRAPPEMQQATLGPPHRRVYERSFSPPRSSNSSGYGTGSSSKSFHGQENVKYAANNDGMLTNSLNGPSNSDEKWYDILQEFDNTKSTPKQHKQHTKQPTNTFPASPKRQNNNQQPLLPSKNQHLHFNHHNKIFQNSSLPVNFNSISDEQFEKNNLLKQQNEFYERNVNYDRLNVNFDRSSVRNDVGNFDGHRSSNGSLNLIGSEDERLSNGSMSPKSRKCTKNATIGGYGSRNNSPRSIINGENAAKLRPGVSSRSVNRNSANLASNPSFQEELLRLINPDSIDIDGVEGATCSLKNDNSIPNNHKHGNYPKKNKNQDNPEVILTMARPATVISNTSSNSSPLQTDFLTKSSKNSHLLDSFEPLNELNSFPLPEGSSDWSSLVDTTNRTIGGATNVWSEDAPSIIDDDEASLIQNSNLALSTSVPELQNHVVELESKVTQETKRRMSLENEVRKLRDENRKLRDQANAAVQQLRKFTEWFFHNVKRQ